MQFEPRSSQTNDFKSDTCRFLAWCMTFIGQGKDCLAQCQGNVTEWDAGLPVGQHYKVAMSLHCYKSVSVLI